MNFPSFRLLRRVMAALLLAIAVAGGGALWWLQQPLGLSAATLELEIEPGQSPRDDIHSN